MRGRPFKKLARWRRTALRDFKRQVGHLAEEFEPRFADRYGTSASFLKRMAHPERIAAAASSLAWPDHDLALRACGGARLVGEVEKAFICRPTHIIPEWSTGELLRTAEAYVQEVMLRPQPKAAEAKVIWEKTLEEVGLGYMLGPFSKEQIDQEWGVGKWRCIVRFAKKQRDGSFRVIDNGKSGGHNGSTEAYERIHTCGSAASVALVREFTRLINAPLEGNYTVLQGTQDMKKAFRQIPIHDESLRFCVIAVWHPQMFAMPFGLMAAVLQFNRVSGLLVALARRIALSVLGYFDDLKYTMLAGGGAAMCGKPRYQAIFEDLVSWVGYVLDPMKMQPLATQIKFLGDYGTGRLCQRPRLDAKRRSHWETCARKVAS